MNKKKPVLFRLFDIAAEGKGKLLLSCTFMSLGTLCGMIPYLSVYHIARLLLPAARQGGLSGGILLWSIAAAISILLNTVLSFFGSFGAHKVAFRVLYGIRIRVMEHMGRLPMGFFTEHTSGSVQKTMDDSIEKIEIFIAHLLPDLVGSACAVLALLLGLGRLNLWLALAVVAAVILACALQLSVWGGNRGQDILTGLAAVSGQMTGAFSEYVRGIAEVKLFGLTGTITRGLGDTTKKYGNWEMKLYKRVAPFYEGYKTMILSLLAVVVPVGTFLIWQHPGNTSVLLSVIMGLILTPAICAPLMELVNYGTRMGEITVALHNIDEIMRMEPMPEPVTPKIPESFDVKFHDVSFSYQDTADPSHTLALSHISFTAPQKQMTALVGPSGGGKSTIGQLISRFWDVTSGKITIGGVDIRDISPSRLMEYVSFVFQDTTIFSDTVYGNITMNRPLEKEQVIAAAKAARCHEFIMRLPKGYDTVIGSGGVGLSGGEAQRLAIARAILKDSPIVILDEALAYSDAENENLIQQAIDKLIENRTVIIIAHRLPSIQGADQILVLSRGEIQETGTHDTLMRRDTLYQELWTLQNEVDSWSIKKGTTNRERSEAI
ncbi:ABC transporter ATP-binding protein [Oscillibacter sp.]|uniref:ABC transporter ATP-binding protein n=1 Tax=Oscillibacter sp. TaxID=1945593 RepID=UPI0028997895|nr:ABC transporter ATP-binding protein [Oscillibacter sp.]